MTKISIVPGIALLATGCVGGIDDSTDSRHSGGPGGAFEEGWGTAPATCEVSPNSGRVVARRLSRGEYNNTVRDLFGFDVGRPADDFPDDVTGGDRDNNNGLVVSDSMFERAETAANRMAAAAIQHGFITCDPTKMDSRACAKQILEPFMTRARRRPVTPQEVDGVLGYLAITQAEASEPDPFRQAIKLAIADVLLSPSFLFRFETLPDAASAKPQRLGSYDLASRLSYF